MGKDLNGKNIGQYFSQRKDGRYEARARINGVKIDIYDKSLACLKRKFEEEFAKALVKEHCDYTELTLGEWYREWFEKFKSPQLKSDLSRKPYDRKIRNTFIKILGDKKIQYVTFMDIQTAANELIDVQAYKPRTIKEALGGLQECLEIAVANRIIPANVCKGVSVKVGDEVKKERRVLEQWEQDLFLEEIEGSYYFNPYRFLLLTGVRIGEFSGLQWNDIDFKKEEIHINRSMLTGYLGGEKLMKLVPPKTTNSVRTIPFFEKTGQVLRDWRRIQEEYKKALGDRWRCPEEFGDLVFTTTMGSPITRYNLVHDINKVVRNIREKELRAAIIEDREPKEFKHLHPHALRHTFCTRCFEKGMDPVVVQALMGHAHYSTTLSYTHVLEDKIKKETKKIGNFLK